MTNPAIPLYPFNTLGVNYIKAGLEIPAELSYKRHREVSQ